MKLTKEIKTAILVIVSIFLFIWGYNFLKGKDLFDSSTRVYVVYDNVAGLVNSAPVTLNGLAIGKVNSINIQPDGKLLVEMQITTDFPIAKSSVAEIYDSGLVGGRQIAIKPNFQDKDYIKTGDYLKASSKLGLTDALAQQLEPLQYKVQKLLDNADVLFTNVNEILDEKTKQNLKNSIAELNKTLSEFSVASKNINEMIADNKSKINSTMTNFDKTAANFSKMSDSLAKANLGQTVKNLEKTLANVDKIMTDIEQGKGTMGKLMKDDAMYNNFTNTSKELELLLQDVRLNPTRYVNVSVFGKKNKPYVAPVNDTIKK
ncbi:MULTISPECIES: MlaD family protein [Flavobacterium]|uniref:Phospholipid/cholesterol/gamma-HCH transport system substrate-binding protein n=2 Tax=Flavobacterium TaxID=237 RepID=A0A562KS31_9FLAO|nr:MlaD family protein [Flavobacterium cheniae]TDR25566.1 phospholipid/cholesterol/gamma-HCH transport system substrate-binding protein [Flavobacterium cheniae]TWH98248.1 phospholipid/cholesterol/gamma-HCH transport system substrate-binding protein [Flavobacterium cheniae]